MIEVCSLSSGSNGNCFYIRLGEQRFLVDAGISCKQIVTRLQQIGVDVRSLSGILVTHEHSDHTRGLPVLLKKHPLPVYITEKTLAQAGFSVPAPYLQVIARKQQLEIDAITIQVLPKSHDAIEPTLFCFFYKGKKISVITDVGYACENVMAAVRDAHVIFLETNYDDSMLWAGEYPHYLKKRIASAYGHLSNSHAGELIYQSASQQLSHVFLSHLSENNNHPDLALATFRAIIQRRQDLSHVQTLLTSRNTISPLVRLEISGPGY